MVFVANIVFNFHTGFSITLTFLLVNVHLMQNMKKTPLKYQFLCFFHNIGPKFGLNFAPKTHGCYKSFEFGNGSRMSDENLVILEFKYLQNKKW